MYFCVFFIHVLSIFHVLSFAHTTRHSPQSLSSPINITIIPTNDNPPEAFTPNSSVTYIEEAAPILLLPDIQLLDRDESCVENHLSYALVTLEPDSVLFDRLQVNVPLTIHNHIAIYRETTLV